MTQSRLDLAFPDGHPGGEVLFIGATAAEDLSPLDPQHLTIVQGHVAEHDGLAARGLRVSPAVDGTFDTAIVRLPRAKEAARARLALAAAHLAPGAPLWVDGQKTDGADALLKELRALAPVTEVISKAHGKIFRLTLPPEGLPEAWQARAREVVPGFTTLPGVFSADHVDPGSRMLVDHLPPKLPTRIVDLGAGWGWLSAQALARAGVTELHLVEADHAALTSARQNVTDPRARFHWADARDFALKEPVNGVIMNPPFHAGREADPRLGAAFIATAARLLTGAGKLWMVANRHLPYEQVLAQHFGQVHEIAGDTRFKVIEASAAGKGSATTRKAARR
ncbi:class I SAM-dependent methyltransferase [Paracoccus gahaiensis]|uniref:Class I SAM-dependent methyltransferase n=1 Tax=Paracoccus gahaiensis TaxID=1706839 RepID=A0A4U0RGU5_9RHOB|nr:class I SAM-dependent methyltransferase [Paracoccus gahaiensis]TJZ94002.1 class I SAM-dependent methyltransferase [Paracoccus gahaiensis]